MVYRQAPFSANLHFFSTGRTSPEYAKASYLKAWKQAEDIGLKLASHKVLEEHIQKCPGYEPMWEREVIAYPESGKMLRRNRDITDVNGFVLPGCYVPAEADRVPGIALVIDPGRVEEFRSKTVIHPDRLGLLRNFPQGNQSDDYGMPIDFFSDSGKTGRILHRYWAGGVRPIIRRIYGGMKHLSVDYCPSAPMMVVAEEPLTSGISPRVIASS
jgi:hypothetical protein